MANCCDVCKVFDECMALGDNGTIDQLKDTRKAACQYDNVSTYYDALDKIGDTPPKPHEKVRPPNESKLDRWVKA